MSLRYDHSDGNGQVNFQLNVSASRGKLISMYAVQSIYEGEAVFIRLTLEFPTGLSVMQKETAYMRALHEGSMSLRLWTSELNDLLPTS